MRCEQAGEMMSARLDGTLGRTEVARLEDHLAMCSACRVEWQRVRALDRLLRSVPMHQAPLGLRAQVMTRIDRREQARRAIIGGLTLVLGTATLALLLLAPFALGLLSNLGIAPTLLVGGLETVTQLLVLVDALGRMLFVLLDQFALPLAVLSLCSLVVALALNGLWIRTVRRLSVAH
ncbi:MAG: anti-sigma factor [Anaerolineae bacterium]|jgi:predicted anti-sigma-YlaC factor YlaD